MVLTVPPELKKITPFIRRAEELDKDKANPESRLVAYYCRQYAVHVGIPLASSPATKECLGQLLNDLETEKQAMSAFTRDEAKFLCRKFADKIFGKADDEDRAGAAGKGTAKTFYAAASFYEMLGQFYADADESEERDEEKKKTVYSKWKATEILKAIKAGRQPTPGGYGENDGEKEEEQEQEPAAETMETNAPAAAAETITKDDEFPSVPSVEPLRPPPPIDVPVAPEEEEEEEPETGTEVELGPPPAYPGLPSEPSESPGEVYVPDLPMPPADRPPVRPTFNPPPKKKTGFLGMGGKKAKGGKATKAEMADALELSKFAVAALEAKDGALAATRLKQALAILEK